MHPPEVLVSVQALFAPSLPPARSRHLPTGTTDISAIPTAQFQGKIRNLGISRKGRLHGIEHE
jgi:hypothetical protein